MKNCNVCKPKKLYFMDQLQNFRKRIDKIDSKIVILLRKRISIIKKIGLFKAKYKRPVKNESREQEILDKLDNDFEKEIFKTILKESKKIQRSKLT